MSRLSTPEYLDFIAESAASRKLRKHLQRRFALVARRPSLICAHWWTILRTRRTYTERWSLEKDWRGMPQPDSCALAIGEVPR